MNQDILTDIIAHKRKEIAIQEAVVSASFLENHIEEPTVIRSMKQRLQPHPQASSPSSNAGRHRKDG